MVLAPEEFLRPGDENPYDGTDPSTVQLGWLDGYRMVHEHDDEGCSAYSLDVRGLVAAGDTRAEVEQLLHEALPSHLALPSIVQHVSD